MAVYIVTKDDTGRLRNSEELLVGESILKHEGAELPVEIHSDDSVTIHLGGYRGEPMDLYIFGQSPQETMGLLTRGVVQELKLRAEPTEVVVSLQGVYEDSDLQVGLARYNTPPGFRM